MREAVEWGFLAPRGATPWASNRRALGTSCRRARSRRLPGPGPWRRCAGRWSALMALAAAGAWVHHLSHRRLVAGRRRGRSSSARCTRRSSPTTRASARSAAWIWCRPAPRPPPRRRHAGHARTPPAAGCAGLGRVRPLRPGSPSTPARCTRRSSPPTRARCPKCKMKLVPRAAPPRAQRRRRAAAGPAGVPGLVPVELTSDRIQLMGMKTAVATLEPLGTSLRAVGFVTANESGLISVNTRYSGWVENLPVAQTGQLVQKGEVLATIYSPELLNAQAVFLNAVKWAGQAGTAPAAPQPRHRPGARRPAAARAARHGPRGRRRHRRRRPAHAGGAAARAGARLRGPQERGEGALRAAGHRAVPAGRPLHASGC